VLQHRILQQQRCPLRRGQQVAVILSNTSERGLCQLGRAFVSVEWNDKSLPTCDDAADLSDRAGEAARAASSVESSPARSALATSVPSARNAFCSSTSSSESARKSTFCSDISTVACQACRCRHLAWMIFEAAARLTYSAS
jgi:hypothetical protein